MSLVRDDKDTVEMFESFHTRSEDAFSTVKKNWQEDNDFSLGSQWDEASQASRSLQGSERPCLTINKAEPLVYRMVNDAREKKLSNKVVPVGDGADVDTALILSGVIRNFEYRSNAVRAYMWAYECSLRGGIGAVKVLPEYEEHSFDQTVRIARIKDPMCVDFDPDAEDPTAKDGRMVGISENISRDAADKIVKDSGKEINGYVPKKSIWQYDERGVRHGEIWWFEEEPDILYLLKDGSLVRKSEISKEAVDLITHTPGMITRMRKDMSKKLHYANICDGVVIEATEVEGDWLPIVRFIGREGYINQELDYKGIVRNMKDSNRMYNVMSSLLIERVGLAPRAPWIGAAGQFEGYEDQWLNANTQNLPKLEYNPISISGTVLGAPQRTDVSSGDPTIERYMAIASNDIKDTSQISDAFLGNKTNMTSGAGVKALSAQSDTATFDFFDSACRSIEHCARVALSLSQKILTDRQVVMIMGEDYTKKVVDLNAFQKEDGTITKVNLDIGKYEVEQEVATGDKTRRETAIEQLSFVLQTNPAAANLIMDVFVSNLDVKDAQKISKRFKATLPPQVLAAETADENNQNPEVEALHQHAAQIIQQMKQNLDQTQAQLQQAQKELADKNRDLDIKQKAVDNNFVIAQQEVSIKKQDAQVKEATAADKIDLGTFDRKHQIGKQASTSGSSSKSSQDNTAVDNSHRDMVALSKVQELQSEVDELHKHMDLITHVLAQLKISDSDMMQYIQEMRGSEQSDPNETAMGGMTQSPDAQAAGSSAPPVESDNTVGDTNV